MLEDIKEDTFGLRTQRAWCKSCLYNTCRLWDLEQVPASLPHLCLENGMKTSRVPGKNR